MKTIAMAGIEKFEEIIQDYIGPNKIVVEKKIKNLMAPGENYLSEIKKIDLVLKNKESGVKEELNLVAKCYIELPFGPIFFMMENQINFYTKTIPAIYKFQDKHGQPRARFFPKYIGSRRNLTGDKEINKDAVLVQENLTTKGYAMQDRHVGFDSPTAKVILKDIAAYHATALALKILEPETFQTEIKASCNIPSPPPKKDGENHKDHPTAIQSLRELIKSDQELSKHSTELGKFLDNMEAKFKPENFFKQPVKEPFCTLTHSDLWINNTMQKFINGVIVGNKFVDFQMCRIGSPIGDLSFFIFSSIQSKVIENELDNLLQIYYDEFADVLKKYGVYGSQFSYEKFLEELNANVLDGISRCLSMLPTAVFNEKGIKFDMENAKLTLDTMPDLAKKKLKLVFLEALHRNWIK